MRSGLVLIALVLVPGTAHAGRTFYGWLYGTEVLPERGAELMTWVAEENRLHDEGELRETRWWVGPLIGINDQLELALPFELAWNQQLVTDPTTMMTSTVTHNGIDRYGVELRYRFVTQDPVDAPPFVPLLRVAVNRLVLERDVINPEVDIVVSYQVGSFQALADFGTYAELDRNNQHFEVRPGAGISIAMLDDLRFGAEIHAELTLDQGGSWAVAGPNMAWSHGRSWLSAMYGIGFYGIRNAPKVQWGIAF